MSKSGRFVALALLILLVQASSGFANLIPAEGANRLASKVAVGVAAAQAPQAAPPLYLPLVFKNYSQYSALRVVNIPYFASPGNPDNTINDVQWTQSAIFWFGKYQLSQPGTNYADVRIAYSSYGLHVRVIMIDYYLWFKDNPLPSPTTDLTQYDSVALYVDTNFDRAGLPQADDYFFLKSGNTWESFDNPAYYNYRRQGRGSGTGWATWTTNWLSSMYGEWWQNPGFNDNIQDYGTAAVITIPWASLGQSGPPAQGMVWGLGMIMYDRDTANVSGVTMPQVWPEAFSTTDPGTWGRLHFGPFQSTPPGGTPQGTTVIRAATTEDNTVEDAWMGGGGNCLGGQIGGGETNHGVDTDLFAASQVKIADFPCFSKSYLRFSLSSIPAGKAILSATMTLYHWGNANPSSAQPSWAQLFTVADPWGEMTIHWNNAPLAKENVAATWINPRPAGQTGPADPYHWDATQAVIEAYDKGQPLNVAIYSSDSGFDSSKYLVSSENFNTVERPKLTVTWGSP